MLRVNYPGLESFPNHTRAKKLFNGFGSTLSFELADGAVAADRFMKRVKLPINAPSLGVVDIGHGLVRLSIGLESVEDLIEDFDQALAV